MRFPFIGSLVLFSLFLVFKFLPKDLVNMVLTLYFVALGALAISAVILPFVNSLFSQRLQEGIYEVRQIQIPYVIPVCP
jgi:minor histocompatibility antigen H13